MEIPITIITENKPEVAQSLMGVAGKVDNPEIKEKFGEDAVWINKSVKIKEGIELHYPTDLSNAQEGESVQSDDWFDWNLSLVLSQDTVSLSQCASIIAQWLWDRLKWTEFEIRFNGKKFSREQKESFQSELDQYIRQ